MGAMGWQHWLLVLVIVVLLFGAPKLPALARSVAESMKIFRKEFKGEDDSAAKRDGTASTNDEAAAQSTEPQAKP